MIDLEIFEAVKRSEKDTLSREVRQNQLISIATSNANKLFANIKASDKSVLDWKPFQMSTL